MKPIFWAVVVLVSLGLTGCRQQSQVISIITGENLLQNPSFEENDKSSGRFWSIHNFPGFQFAKDTPPDGGTWSLSLTSDWTPPSVYASQTIATPPGIRDFRLTFWVKNEFGGNAVIIRGIFADTTQTVASLTTEPNKVWKAYTLTFQIPLPAPDSLRVELWAAPTELQRIITLYDLITLEPIQ